MKKIVALILALLMVFALAACGNSNTGSSTVGSSGGSTPDPTPPPADDVFAPVDIVVNLDNISLSGLDPQASSSTNITHFDMIFNGLMRINEDTFLPEPDLAESYEVSDDGLVYTFKLKEGVQFHRGYGEMTADDVVFSLLRAKEHPTSQYHSWLTILESAEAVDKYTAKFTLNQVYPDFTYLVSDELGTGLVTSKKAWEELGDEGFAKTPVGTGPFIFAEDEWVPQQSSKFYANEDYFGEKARVNVTITEVKDGSTTLLAYQNNEIDFFLSSQLEIVQQAEAAGAIVDFKAAPIMYGIFFNGDVYEPFKDPKVREALYHAIDRDSNRNAVFGEKMAREAIGVLPDVLPGYTTEGVLDFEYDPELAKQLLKEAGYENSIEFTAYIQNNVRNERIFTMIQQQFEAVGVKMDIQAVSTTEYYAASEERRAACSYSSVQGMPNIYMVMSQAFISGTLRNYTDYSGVDDLAEQISQIPEGPERNELYKEVQVQLSKDMPYFPHHFVNVIMVSNPKLHGIYSKGANGGDIRFDKAWVSE